MGRTYAQITNAERIKNDEEGIYYFAKIPKSKYHLVSRTTEKKNWTTWIMDLVAKQRTLIGENLSTEQTAELYAEIETQMYFSNKVKPKLRILKMRLTNLIK